MNLYHVTPDYNLDSINLTGIDPGHSKGKMRCSWWVMPLMVDWAIIHVSSKYHVSTDHLLILGHELPVAYGQYDMSGFIVFRSGVYRCTKIVSLFTIETVAAHLAGFAERY